MPPYLRYLRYRYRQVRVLRQGRCDLLIFSPFTDLVSNPC